MPTTAIAPNPIPTPAVATAAAPVLCELELDDVPLTAAALSDALPVLELVVIPLFALPVPVGFGISVDVITLPLSVFVTTVLRGSGPVCESVAGGRGPVRASDGRGVPPALPSALFTAGLVVTAATAECTAFVAEATSSEALSTALAPDASALEALAMP